MNDISASNTEYTAAPEYDPIKGQQITCSTLPNIFKRDEYIQSNNIPMSSDGSIYNLSTYYMYCREKIVGKTTPAYLL